MVVMNQLLCKPHFTERFLDKNLTILALTISYEKFKNQILVSFIIP